MGFRAARCRAKEQVSKRSKGEKARSRGRGGWEATLLAFYCGMDGWVNGWMDGWDGVRALNEMERLSGLALLWTPGRSPRLAPPAVARVESSPHVPETHGGGPAKPKARNPGGREDADAPTHTHADFVQRTKK